MAIHCFEVSKYWDKVGRGAEALFLSFETSVARTILNNLECSTNSVRYDTILCLLSESEIISSCGPNAMEGDMRHSQYMLGESFGVYMLCELI